MTTDSDMKEYEARKQKARQAAEAEARRIADAETAKLAGVSRHVPKQDFTDMWQEVYDVAIANIMESFEFEEDMRDIDAQMQYPFPDEAPDAFEHGFDAEGKLGLRRRNVFTDADCMDMAMCEEERWNDDWVMTEEAWGLDRD